MKYSAQARLRKNGRYAEIDLPKGASYSIGDELITRRNHPGNIELEEERVYTVTGVRETRERRPGLLGYVLPKKTARTARGKKKMIINPVPEKYTEGNVDEFIENVRQELLQSPREGKGKLHQLPHDYREEAA